MLFKCVASKFVYIRSTVDVTQLLTFALSIIQFTIQRVVLYFDDSTVRSNLYRISYYLDLLMVNYAHIAYFG